MSSRGDVPDSDATDAVFPPGGTFFAASVSSTSTSNGRTSTSSVPDNSYTFYRIPPWPAAKKLKSEPFLVDAAEVAAVDTERGVLIDTPDEADLSSDFVHLRRCVAAALSAHDDKYRPPRWQTPPVSWESELLRAVETPKDEAGGQREAEADLGALTALARARASAAASASALDGAPGPTRIPSSWRRPPIPPLLLEFILGGVVSQDAAAILWAVRFGVVVHVAVQYRAEVDLVSMLRPFNDIDAAEEYFSDPGKPWHEDHDEALMEAYLDGEEAGVSAFRAGWFQGGLGPSRLGRLPTRSDVLVAIYQASETLEAGRILNGFPALFKKIVWIVASPARRPNLALHPSRDEDDGLALASCSSSPEEETTSPHGSTACARRAIISADATGSAMLELVSRVDALYTAAVALAGGELPGFTALPFFGVGEGQHEGRHTEDDGEWFAGNVDYLIDYLMVDVARGLIPEVWGGVEEGDALAAKAWDNILATLMMCPSSQLQSQYNNDEGSTDDGR